MIKLLPWLGLLAGGAFGWWLGRHVGFFTAYMSCVFGSALGLFYGRRLVKRILGEA